MICRGHIRASNSTFQIFPWLTVLWQILHFDLHFWSNLKGSLMDWEVKNLLSCQSKHGLVGSSAKTGNFVSRELQEWKTCTFLGSKHKSAIWDGTPPPPHLHIKSSLYVWGAHGSQIFKQNSIILIHSCFIEFLRFRLLQLQGVGQVGRGYLGWSEWVRMSSEMFRGKDFSNRIELSWLVQDL